MSDDRLRRLAHDARHSPTDPGLVVPYLAALDRAGQLLACPGSWSARHRVKLWRDGRKTKLRTHPCAGKHWWTFVAGGKRDPANKRTTNFGEVGRFYLVPCQPKGAGWWFDTGRVLPFDSTAELLEHVAERLVEWREVTS